MSLVTVSGFVPRKEIGMMEYDSAIYHIFMNDGGKLRFLVWNPFLNEFRGGWETVGESSVRPAMVPSQQFKTKKQLEAWKYLIEKERKESGKDDEQG